MSYPEFPRTCGCDFLEKESLNMVVRLRTQGKIILDTWWSLNLVVSL